MSHYPAIPPPISLSLWESPPHPCVYLPGREAKIRAFMTHRIPPQTYRDFMDANFRRSGKLIYQPSCAGCRQCQSLRVPVTGFRPSKSQRRCVRKNLDLKIFIAAPEPTEEKFDLYRRYQSEWHGKDESGYAEFCEFLYDSPVETIEFAYRDPAGKLLAIGICDISPAALSSVYFYFDPAASHRNLGTFGALCEIQHAAKESIAHYYLGYWVAGCSAMHYKAAFRPHEILCSDGVWREHEIIDANRNTS